MQTDYKGWKVRWTEEGRAAAPPIVLLHGIYAGAHGYEWRRLVPELVPHFRVRVPDLLGAGDSDRPDIAYYADVITDVVRAIIEGAGPDAHVVASSLTGAHAVRAVATGSAVASLTAITPTGRGKPRAGNGGPSGRRLYDVLRKTPLGRAIVWGLTSGTSVSWFQRNKTYRDARFLTDEEVANTRRAGRARGAGHLQLAFVLNQLSVDISDTEIRDAKPLVVWADGQDFVDNREAESWAAAGATVEHVESGLPQVEDPVRLAALIRRHLLP